MRAALLCLCMLLCLLWVTMAHGDEPDDTITVPRDIAVHQLAKYMAALAAVEELAAENAKLKQRMEICWAGFGGFKN